MAPKREREEDAEKTSHVKKELKQALSEQVIREIKTALEFVVTRMQSRITEVTLDAVDRTNSYTEFATENAQTIQNSAEKFLAHIKETKSKQPASIEALDFVKSILKNDVDLDIEPLIENICEVFEFSNDQIQEIFNSVCDFFNHYEENVNEEPSRFYADFDRVFLSKDSENPFAVAQKVAACLVMICPDFNQIDLDALSSECTPLKFFTFCRPETLELAFEKGFKFTDLGKALKDLFALSNIHKDHKDNFNKQVRSEAVEKMTATLRNSSIEQEASELAPKPRFAKAVDFFDMQFFELQNRHDTIFITKDNFEALACSMETLLNKENGIDITDFKYTIADFFDLLAASLDYSIESGDLEGHHFKALKDDGFKEIMPSTKKIIDLFVDRGGIDISKLSKLDDHFAKIRSSGFGAIVDYFLFDHVFTEENISEAPSSSVITEEDLSNLLMSLVKNATEENTRAL